MEPLPEQERFEPLMDNLEAQTYETFEKNSVKYIQVKLHKDLLHFETAYVVKLHRLAKLSPSQSGLLRKLNKQEERMCKVRDLSSSMFFLQRLF
ncbi:hypothetical protein LXL04_011347 [Taraxacum kok-saghyz]